MVAQKLVDAKVHVAAANNLEDAIADADDWDEADDVCDSPLVGDMKTVANIRRAFAAATPAERWRLEVAAEYTGEWYCLHTQGG